MATNIEDLSGMVGLTFRADWEAAYINPAQLNANGDGSYTIGAFDVNDHSANPESWSNFTLDIQGATGDGLDIYIPEFDMAVAANVLAYSQETLLIYIPDLDEHRLLLTENWRSDPNYNFSHSSEGSGFTKYYGAISVSETSPDAPFDLPVVCFAEGTMIATAEGERRVEMLEPGDLVLTASGALRPVKWIGTMLVRPSRRANPVLAHPIRVRAGAFADHLPKRDLLLSPGHAVYVDGVLVPVGLLVNGATILQDEVEQIRYFHVELDSHDVLLAEGLPCESYLDDGNRASFVNAGQNTELVGRLDPKSWDDACAPMVAAGPQLSAVQQILVERMSEMGWMQCEEADLRLLAGGTEIFPTAVHGNRFCFRAPMAASLKLSSTSGILSHVIPALADTRRLGVAVTEVNIDGKALPLDDIAFGAGFYPLESHDALSWRWTNGEAEICLSLAATAEVEVVVAMVAPIWRTRLPKPALAAA
ncbi:Hint domain-containing protein [Sphingobium sp. CFD-2]|uniref:Hint domain-containing protein n=1 Tax=Sphingobium sp. CFD-2 TaxID=2878542 RepID=UPI00214D01D3|nr:Hint domain-containing protein [Sphingobium sp. CFD-2]